MQKMRVENCAGEELRKGMRAYMNECSCVDELHNGYIGKLHRKTQGVTVSNV